MIRGGIGRSVSPLSSLAVGSLAGGSLTVSSLAGSPAGAFPDLDVGQTDQESRSADPRAAASVIVMDIAIDAGSAPRSRPGRDRAIRPAPLIR